MRTSVLAALVAATCACQSSKRAPPAATAPADASSPALVRDLEQICNAIERSGATDMAPNDRMYTMAQWLPRNVSEEGRQWLIRFARLGDDAAARRRMLETDARAAGLTDCPLVAAWQ